MLLILSTINQLNYLPASSVVTSFGDEDFGPADEGGGQPFLSAFRLLDLPPTAACRSLMLVPATFD